MLVKDENKFCYIVNNKTSEPKDSLKEAIQDYLEEAKENGYSLDSVEIANPYFFVPELSGRRIVDNLIYDFPNIKLCTIALLIIIFTILALPVLAIFTYKFYPY